MNFTEEEKEAIMWALMVLADCDGMRNMDEIEKLTDISSFIDFKVSMDRLFEISKTEPADFFETLRSLTSDKKEFLKFILRELALIDSEINKSEIDTMFNIIYFGKL